MKKSFMTIFMGALLGIFLLTDSSFTASAQSGLPIMRRVKEIVGLLEDDNDETIAAIQVDNLSQSSNIKTYTRTLYSGNDYTAVAAGDNRIHDTDLVVYRRSGDSWVEVGRDADVSNTAVVNFHCSSTGDYKFEIKAYSFESGYSYGFYGFVLSFD